MRAAVFHGRGDVRVEEVAEPREPRAGELLLDVGLAAICGTDSGEWLHGPRFVPLEAPHPSSGHVGPTILGHEFFGRVRSTAAEGFEPGQRVVSGAGVWCGSCAWCRAGRTNLCERYYTLGLHTHGGLAEQVLAPALTCVPVPDACTDEAAALAQPLAIALHAIRQAGVVAGESVLVIGAGGIGAFVVAAAAAAGAAPLLALDVDERRLETARRLGAETADVAGEVDVAVEASGTEAGLATALAAVRRGGRVLLVGHQAEPRRVDLFDLAIREIAVATTQAHVCSTDIPEALRILTETDLAGQVVDRTIPLEAVVDEGLAALAERRANGKILVRP